MNAGRPPRCRYSCRMSGVFGHRFGRKYRARALRELGEVLGRAPRLRVAPGEVGVRLVKPSLASRCITFGRVNASDEEDHVRVRAL